MLKNLSENTGYIAALIGALTTIFAFKPLRKVALFILRPIWMPYEILRTVREVKNGVGDLDARIRRIEHAAMRSESRLEHWFWVQGRPAMEMDQNGKVLRVSAACCQLFKVDRVEELSAMSWMRFLEGAKTNDFRHAMLDMMKFDSRFDYVIRLHTDHPGQREDRGEWRLSLVPLPPRIDGEGLFSGVWIPMDPVAKAIAGKKHWSIEEG